MPEGDTIHRAAARLEPALTGAVLDRFSSTKAPRPHPRPGEHITAVEARGKHLLVHFDGGLVLDTHLGMSGSWHLYRRGDRWRRPAHLARVVVEVPDWTAVCFSAPTVRLAPAAAAPASHLGPDLCDPSADLGEVVRRVRALDPGTALVEALLDQRVFAGVGNVFKSEVCFAARLHPLVAVGSLDDATLEAVARIAARQLRSNLRDGARSTVGARPGALAVYGRVRRPCRRCGTPIVSHRTGRHRRSTYWCPTCQPQAGRDHG